MCYGCHSLGHSLIPTHPGCTLALGKPARGRAPNTHLPLLGGQAGAEYNRGGEPGKETGEDLPLRPRRRGSCCGDSAETRPQSRWQLVIELKMPRESKGMCSPWYGGQGPAGSQETVLLPCHDCPAHRTLGSSSSHTRTAQFALYLRLCAYGVTSLADPPCPHVPRHHST